MGDLHAEFPQYRNIVNNTDLPTIQVGDFGLGFGTPPELNPKDRFIRGNHDSPLHCRDNANWIPDGHVEELCGLKTYFIGGAYSVDKDWRTPYKNWWPDEELSYKELQDEIDRYIEIKPDLVISHDCPESVGHYIIQKHAMLLGADSGHKIQSRTCHALQEMWLNHPPKIWVFGHWHLNFTLQHDKTYFRCVRTLDTVKLSDLIQASK